MAGFTRDSRYGPEFWPVRDAALSVLVWMAARVIPAQMIGTETKLITMVWGAVEAKAYVIFKMVYMEKSRLENNHGENNMEKHYNENFI
jgi:hypothetical protein